jgi:hypothetical protein
MVISAVVAFVAWIVHVDRRRNAIDRMVELDPFTPSGQREPAGGPVDRRRAELSSGGYRRMLAGRARNAAGAEFVVRRFGAPGVRALAAEPALAERVADVLEHDGDERLPLAVHRLLTAGGVDRHSLDRVRGLVA